MKIYKSKRIMCNTNYLNEYDDAMSYYDHNEYAAKNEVVEHYLYDNGTLQNYIKEYVNNVLNEFLDYHAKVESIEPYYGCYTISISVDDSDYKLDSDTLNHIVCSLNSYGISMSYDKVFKSTYHDDEYDEKHRIGNKQYYKIVVEPEFINLNKIGIDVDKYAEQLGIL